MTENVPQHKIVQGGKPQKSESSLIFFRNWKRVRKCLACFHNHLYPLLHSSLLAQSPSVPMVLLSVPRILDSAPVAFLTPPSWCTAEGAVLVNPGGDRSVMVWFLVAILW